LPQENLRDVGTLAHAAPERLQVPEQLTEPREMAAAAAGLPVAAPVERVDGEARLPQPLRDVAPAAGVVGPAVEDEDRRARRRAVQRFVMQRQSVRRDQGWHQAPPSRRRSRSSAACALRYRTSSRSPGKMRFKARTFSPAAAASHTVPTGFSGVPPDGPAMPVTARAQ